MAEMLTLADVWNPMESALKIQQLDEMRTRSRLQAMQMQEYQKSQQFKNSLAQVWQGLLGDSQGAGGQQAASPPGGPPAPAPQQPQPGPQQAQGQPQAPQQAPNPSQQKLKYYVAQAHQAIASGDDAKLQQLTQWGQSQPDIAPLLEKSGIISTNTYGPDKYEQVVTLDDKGIQARLQKNPELKDILTKPGTYRLRYEKKDGKEYVTLAEPHKEETNKLSDEEIVAGALEEKLGRKPTKQELLKAMETHKKNTSLQGDSVPFNQWSKDDKEWWFENKKSTGEMPRFGFGDRTSYNNFNREYASWARGKGVTPTEAATEQAGFKADTASIKNQVKVRDMMGSFTKNLDFQVSRLNDRINKISRTDARIINLPIREALMKVKGSANESILSMYLTDISNDIAKLSTGSSASVRELSKDAQERWAKIHDPNLSIKDILTLVSETKVAAHGRMTTADQQIAETRARMSGKEKEPEAKKEERTVTRTGKDKSGRKVVQYSDGSIEYAP